MIKCPVEYQNLIGRAPGWKAAVWSGILMVPSISAFAMEYYVDADVGNNHQACGAAVDPCKHIGYVLNNLASSGDDIYLVGTTSFAVDGLAIELDVTFRGEGKDLTTLHPRGNGRHFRIDSGATVRFEDMSFEDGFVQGNCGGSIHVMDGNLEVDGVAFFNNEADCGGAVWVEQGTLLSEYSEYRNNRAVVSNGGAIYCQNDLSGASCSSLQIRDSEFAGNTAEQRGGAIYSDATAEIRSSGFEENVAGLYGGAIRSQIYGNDALRVREVQFTANEARYGGALSIGDGDVDVRRSSFVRNTAAVGAAIYGYWTGPEDDDLTITNTTFSANDADTAGGISASGSMYFVTMEGNSGGAGQAQQLFGTFDIYRSLITHTPSAGPGCVGVFGGESNLIDTTDCGSRLGAHNDSALLSLGLRGGRTLSYGLGDSSNALGAANNCEGPNGVELRTDQRGSGYPRPAAGSGCDIGSFERQR